MDSVAERAGVSRKTVSRVVRGEPLVTPRTVARVNAAIAELGFRRNHHASSLRASTSSETIGLLIENAANPFSAAIHRATEETARAHGFFVLTASTDGDPSRERSLVGSLCERRVAGILAVPAGDDHRYLLPEVELGLSVVFLDYPPGHIDADVVVIDNEGGARQGVGHLVGHGHTRIAMLGGPSGAFSMEGRYAGYLAGIRAAGLDLEEDLLQFDIADTVEAQERTTRLMEMPDPPTALFTTNNRLTVGALRAFVQAGRSLAIVGFDDFELADLLVNPVTVVACGADTLARTGADLLFDRIGGAEGPARQVMLPTRLIDRGSARMAARTR